MDYFEPRTIVIAVSTMVFLAIVLDLLRRKKRNRYENLQMHTRDLDRSSRIEEEEDDPFLQSQFPSGKSRVVGMREEDIFVESNRKKTSSSGLFQQPEQGSLDLDVQAQQQEGDSQPVQEINTQQQKTVDNQADQPVHEEVLVIHLMANKGEFCQGQQLLDSSIALGLRYGAMKIFHRHTDEDGSGPILFSMANMLKPGTFDLSTIGELELVGVTLFMTPSELEKPALIFDLMMDTAEKLAAELKLNIMDESRSSMTKQTTDHYRQRAQQSVLLQEHSG